MPISLPSLETQRFQILPRINSLGDLRPGSIRAVARRCGKPTCHCAKPNGPGHDPQIRLTRKSSTRGARHGSQKPLAGSAGLRAKIRAVKAPQAMAELPLARTCPSVSLAPVLSIMRLVAAASKEAV